jgi:hypothetical protein
MRRSRLPLPWLRLAAVLALVAAVAVTARPPVRKRGAHQGVLLPRPELVRFVAASQRPMLVEYYWIEFLQAIALAISAEGYRDVYAYADFATNLDPKFYEIYSLSGLVIIWNEGRGEYANVPESLAILNKGLRQFPGDLRLLLYRAFATVNYKKDYAEGARLLAEVARHPGAPPFVARLATRLFAQSGQFDTGLELARSLRDTATDEETRSVFDKRIQQIELERTLQTIDVAASRYTERSGRRPFSVDELVASGDLPDPPKDPADGRFYFGEDGRARSTSEKSRLEIFRDDP